MLDTPVVLPFWAERRSRQIALYGPEEDEDPGMEGLYAIKEIHVTIAKRTRRRAGRRIPFAATPTSCDGRWTVTTTVEPYKGRPLTARHRLRCADA